MQEHQSGSVEGVVLGGERNRLPGAVPVEGGVEYRFGEIRVGHEVRPHSLSLESAEDCVPALCFLQPAHFCELRVALENIADYAGHLRDELPVLLLFLCGEDGAHIGHAGGRIDVHSLGALLLYPCESLLVFSLVIDSKLLPADYLGHVYPLRVDTEVVAEEILVAVGSGNTHCLGSYIDIALVFHIADGSGAACESEYLFLYIGRDHRVVRVLYVMTVN